MYKLDIQVYIFELLDISDRVRFSWVSNVLYNTCKGFSMDRYSHGVYTLNHQEESDRNNIIHTPSIITIDTLKLWWMLSRGYIEKGDGYKAILSVLLDNSFIGQNKIAVVIMPPTKLKIFLQLAKEHPGAYLPRDPTSSTIVVSHSATCKKHYDYLRGCEEKIVSNEQELLGNNVVLSLVINPISLAILKNNRHVIRDSVLSTANKILLHSSSTFDKYTSLHGVHDISYTFLTDGLRETQCITPDLTGIRGLGHSERLILKD